MREVREIYTRDLLNPFKKDGENLSENFVKRIDEYIKK